MRIALLVAVGCFWTSPVRPAQAAARFTLEYEAPAGCPSRQAFVQAVRDRVPDAEESALEKHFAFRITIEADGELVRGHVMFSDGAPAREVVRAPCADVASAMALMVAIVLAGGAQMPQGIPATEAPRRTPPAVPIRPVAVDEEPKLKLRSIGGHGDIHR